MSDSKRFYLETRQSDCAETFPRYEGLDALRVFSAFGIVFLHVYVSAGYLSSLDWFLKFRDFALPLMVMSSFFLVTISLMRKPEIGFASFLSRRLRRLWIPLIVWTFIYSMFASFLVPLILGLNFFGELPAPIVFFTGYRHLWFLQFIFLGSLASYPLIYWLTGERKPPLKKLSVVCFGATFLYGILFWWFLKDYTNWDNFSPESDISLRIFVSQAGNYVLYIPVAIGIALMSGKVNDLFNRTVFRCASLAIVFVAMIVHIGTNNIPFTREIYGVAVFVAALQPWRKISSAFWRMLAAYSYGIYILHFLLAQLLWLVVFHKNLELSASAVFGSTVIVYFASFAAAVVIRKSVPVDWLIPQVSTSPEQRR